MRPLLATLIAFFLLTSPAAAAWTWPVSGEVIAPYRNGTDPYAAGQHRGIDIGAPVGTSVVAAAAGEVRFAGTAGSSGVTVSIRTGDGYDTSYLHLSSSAVHAGAHVDAGDRIGAVGTTGTRSATQPHLHFGVRDAGTRHAYHDPMKFLPPPTAPPRIPDPPPPATAPEPAPAPPAPVRARGPAPRTMPRPLGAPRPAPGSVPRPAPRGVPRPSPESAPRPGPVSAPRPATRPGRAGRPAPATRTRPSPGPSHLPSPAPGSSQVPRPATDHRGAPVNNAKPRPIGAQHTGHTASPPSESRRDAAPAGAKLGWALACAGLLLAAGVLGLTEGGRRRERHPGRHRREPRATRRSRVASMVHAVLRDDAHLLRQR